MNILLLGNGFDLAHGLATDYSSFINFMSEMKNIEDGRYTQESHNYINDCVRDYVLDAKKNYNTNEKIKNMIDIAKKGNIWLSHFINKCYRNNWVDFEKEISEVLIGLDEVIDFIRVSYPQIHQYYTQKNLSYNIWNIELSKQAEAKDYLISSMNTRQKKAYDILVQANIGKDVLNNICLEKDNVCYEKCIRKLEIDLEELIQALEIYLDLYINNEELKKYSLDVKAIGINHIISFNYTQTYSRCNKYVDVKQENIDYIHGIAQKECEKSNVVLGIDEYLSDDEKNIKLDLIRFKKYFQRIYKKTGCKYKEWINQIKQSKVGHNLYIFGHSLDVTDKDILRELILNDNVTTTIFYPDRDRYEKQIVNLVAVIGQDELIKRVSRPDKTIIFKEQQPMWST